jgi:hypothetical protein
MLAATASMKVEAMSDIDVGREITRLEAEIEVLAGEVASCRKIMLAARLAMTGGGAWIAATMIGLVNVYPVGLVAAFTAVIGGIVAFGSNASTARQAAARMAATEAQRSDLIAGLEMKTISASRLVH